MKRRFAWLALLSVLILALGAQVALASPSGAIFTTLSDGSRVNANIYQAKPDVYLDGGPGPNAPSTAAGLPKGWYYYQVTDPSGKVLLSTDAAKWRMFYVNEAGVISDIVRGSGEHVTGLDQDHGAEGAITVQLMPYLDTPNPGGVYKVWATPVANFMGDPNKVDSGGRFHGFVPSYSKTDNFKVKGVVEQRLIVKKFYDSNGNGCWDEGEPEIYGWPMRIVDPASSEFDPVYSRVDMITQLPGIWSVTEYLKPIAGCELDWKQTALSLDGAKQPVFASINVRYGKTDGEVHTVVFGNVARHKIVAHKFNDKNCNGKQDDGEADLKDVSFTLEGSGAWGSYGPKSVATDADGNAVFAGLLPGTYSLTETVPAGWLPTTPTKISDIVLGGFAGCDPAAYVHEFGFGNVKPGDICGTKFYDKNGNGSWDEGEDAIADFGFRLTGTDLMGNVVDVTKYTDATGKVCFKDLYPGEYKLEEIIAEDSDWKPSALWYSISGGNRVTLEPSESIPVGLMPEAKWDVVFGNTKPACIEAYKYWDKDADGVLDDGEPAKEGWKITLTGTDNMGKTIEEVKYTDSEGRVKFCGLWPGTYKLTEESRDWWLATSPESGFYDGIVVNAEDSVSRTFLNYKYAKLEVIKFHDSNADGEKGDGEPFIEDWGIRLQGPDGFDETKYTDADGRVCFAKLMPGDYTVTELIPADSDWKPTSLQYRVDEGLDLVKVDPPSDTLPLKIESGTKGWVRWGNAGKGCLEAKKFYDFDMDGKRDDDGTEPWLEGWKIEVSGNGLAAPLVGYTDENGYVKFCDLKPGNYTVTEIFPKDPCWQATTAKTADVMVYSHDTAGPVVFGNVCYKTADFGTKGWWQNKNGNQLITADDLAYLNSLDPYNDATEYWDTPFADRYELGEFINNPVSESSHRFQLAQQLAAFILNARHYAGGTDAELTMPGCATEKAQDLIDGAIAAWEDGDPSACSSWICRLDKYNNCDAVYVISRTPCPIAY